MDARPYKIKTYGDEESAICDLADAYENIACLAHDAVIKLQGSTWSENDVRIGMAIETAALIQRIASSGRYSLYVGAFGVETPAYAENHLCIENFFGICGNHQKIFEETMKFLDIETRKVSIYFHDRHGKRHNHAASEFLIDGTWRYIDITWMAFFLDDEADLETIMSFDDVLSTSWNHLERRLVINQTDSWLMSHDRSGADIFAYLKADDDQYILIQKGNSGEMALEIDDVETFEHVPKYLGASISGDDMTLHLRKRNQRHEFYNFKVKATHCPKGEPILDVDGEAYKMKEGDNLIPIDGRQRITVDHAPGAICYVMFDRIERVNKSLASPSAREN